MSVAVYIDHGCWAIWRLDGLFLQLEARQALEAARLEKQRRDGEEKQLRLLQRDAEADERARKKRLGGRKYPVDDLQAFSEALLCDPATMQFQDVARRKVEEQEQLQERKRGVPPPPPPPCSPRYPMVVSSA